MTFLPGVRSNLTFSTNVLRSANASSGWIAEVSPYLEGSIDTDRTKAKLYSSLRSFFRTQGGSSLSPELRATGQTAVIGDWLWISGVANVYTVATTPFGSAGNDPAMYNATSSQFRQFQLSPYIQGRMGTFAEYNVRYSASTAASSANVVLAKLDQRFSGSVKSGPEFNRWGWEVTGETQRRDYDGGVVQTRNSASVSAYFLPTQELRIGGSANYDQLNSFSVSGRTSGAGLGVFADWTPSNRTSVSASAKSQYFGNTGRIAVSHRSGYFTAAMSYEKSVLTSSDASILSMNSSSLFSAGGFSANLNPIYNALASQNLLQTYGISLGGGILSDYLVLNNNLTLSAGYVSPANSLLLTAVRSKRSSDASRSSFGGTFGSTLGASLGTISTINLSNFDTSSLTVDWIHTLDSRSNFGLRVSRIGLESTQNGFAKSIINSVQSTYKTQLTTDTAAILGLRRTRQVGTGLNATSYDETALFGSVDMRF